ncbi:DEAD/DEAH box helicase [Streptomyces sp. NPDC018000]|uniref:DEAD/DEAH box helicase n=1 Tax=Streptomyces sp. NPDC018000 TaxID=3365028 RepID=UPI00378A78A8
MVKNHRTATARALRRIKATIRVALTGTLVENNLTEAWALMDWLNPGLFGTQRVFRDQSARPIEDNIADTERTARLSGLMSAFMLRRRKSDPGILSELPPKDIRPRVVSLTHEQIELYQQTADDTFQAIRDAQGAYRKGVLLELFNKLQQICNSPAQYHKDRLEEEYDPARAASRSGKIGALDDLLPALTAPDESALIFTRYRSMAKLLLRHLRSHSAGVRTARGRTPPCAAVPGIRLPETAERLGTDIADLREQISAYKPSCGGAQQKPPA